MTLTAGTRLGPYEITAPLGAGGMGEVYRARDTRLERSVALKVLPAALSQDADLKARLTREARAISALSHPHICALYDIGAQDGVDYLVMELLEGETLADRLSKGALPVEQVLRHGIEISEALDRAHRGGVVHRDLKPANVMLTRAGVKLLDFGLAKVRETAGVIPVQSSLPTRLASQPLTEKGTILGTFQYMAPEQLEGKEADPRTDLFALGAVLYEMATGRRAFTGTSQASLIAAILSSEPPAISTLQPMSPPALDRLVRICLAKDPEERWQSAHDVAAELRWIAEGGSQIGAPAVLAGRRKGRERLAWVAAGLLALCLAAALYGLARGSRAPRGVVRLSLPPAAAPARGYLFLTPSPDGRSLALVVLGQADKAVLAVRSLDSEDLRILPGTEDASNPFWSPDGRSLGFFAGGKLKRVELSGGPPRVLADAKFTYGGSWSPKGVILFAFDPIAPLFRIPAEGGTPEPVTSLGPGEEAHRWPSFLPDGERFVFLADAPTTPAHTLRIGALGRKDSKKIVQAVSNVVFAPPDRILYVRGGTLVAQRFDLATGAPIGEQTPLGAPIARIADNHYYDFGAGGDLLAFQTRIPERRLVFFDREGKRLSAVGEPDLYADFRISPDGRRIAFGRHDHDGRNENIWVLDTSRGTVTRLTSTVDGDFSPLWSPAGDRVYFSSYRGGKQGDIYATPSGGGGPDELVYASPDQKWAAAASPDGRTLLVQILSEKAKGDVAILTLPEKTLTPVAASPFAEVLGGLSPDGRFVAYSSDESGRFEVYVKSLAGGARVQVSSAGGDLPVWRGDGKELFFVAPGGIFMAAATSTAAAFSAEVPRTLFTAPPFALYDVSPDGQRFLLSLRADGSVAPKTSIVLGWTALLAR